MIVAGIVLNAMVAGSLMKPLYLDSEQPKKKLKSLMERMHEAKLARIRTFSDCPDDCTSMQIDVSAAELMASKLRGICDDTENSGTTEDSGFRSRTGSASRSKGHGDEPDFRQRAHADDPDFRPRTGSGTRHHGKGSFRTRSGSGTRQRPEVQKPDDITVRIDDVDAITEENEDVNSQEQVGGPPLQQSGNQNQQDIKSPTESLGSPQQELPSNRFQSKSPEQLANGDLRLDVKRDTGSPEPTSPSRPTSPVSPKDRFPPSLMRIKRENSYPYNLKRENSYPNANGVVNKNIRRLTDGQVVVSSLANIPQPNQNALKPPVNKALRALQLSNPDMMVNSTSSLRSGIWKRPSYHRITSQNLMSLSPSQNVSVKDLTKELKRPLYRKDIFFSGSVLNLPEFQSQGNMNAYLTSITSIPMEIAMSTCRFEDEMDEGLMPSPCCGPEIRTVFMEMMDFSLLKSPIFMLICLSNILAFAGFYVPFVYTNARALELGIEPNSAAMLLSVIGIANTVSRVATGWICDRPDVNSLLVNNICLLIAGVSTMMVPLCTSYLSLIIYCTTFGLTAGKHRYYVFM